MKRIDLFIVVQLLLVSCSSMDNVVGTYSRGDKFEWVWDEITLNEDGSYYMEGRDGYGYHISNGRWRYDIASPYCGKEIILESEVESIQSFPMTHSEYDIPEGCELRIDGYVDTSHYSWFFIVEDSIFPIHQSKVAINSAKHGSMVKLIGFVNISRVTPINGEVVNPHGFVLSEEYWCEDHKIHVFRLPIVFSHSTSHYRPVKESKYKVKKRWIVDDEGNCFIRKK